MVKTILKLRNLERRMERTYSTAKLETIEIELLNMLFNVSDKDSDPIRSRVGDIIETLNLKSAWLQLIA